MDELKEWIICGIIGIAIWFGIDACENKSKAEKKEEPTYLQWEPAPAPQSSYTPSQNTYTSPSNKSESGYTYSYSSSSSFNSNSSDDDNYENWETEDIRGFYVKLDDCETDEQAEFLSDKYYSGEYIEEGGDYFAKTTVNSGIYEVELSEKVTNKLYKIKGTDCYIYFKWSTSLWKWDEGVMDVWNSKGTFYIKPD